MISPVNYVGAKTKALFQTFSYNRSFCDDDTLMLSQPSQDCFITKNSEDKRIKKLAIMFFDKDILKAIIKNDTNNEKFRYLITSLLDKPTRDAVFKKINTAIKETLKEDMDSAKPDIELQKNLISAKLLLNIVSKDLDKYEKRSLANVAFRGSGDDDENGVISEGFKEFVGEAAPLYRGVKLAQKIVEGDPKAIAKATVATVDNIVLQPVKQAAATAVAVKAAAFGGMIAGPPGAAVGGLVGYLGTILGWGKARNKLVDKILE